MNKQLLRIIIGLVALIILLVVLKKQGYWEKRRE